MTRRLPYLLVLLMGAACLLMGQMGSQVIPARFARTDAGSAEARPSG
jgi:hypothetical protein